MFLYIFLCSSVLKSVFFFFYWTRIFCLRITCCVCLFIFVLFTSTTCHLFIYLFACLLTSVVVRYSANHVPLMFVLVFVLNEMICYSTVLSRRISLNLRSLFRPISIKFCCFSMFRKLFISFSKQNFSRVWFYLSWFFFCYDRKLTRSIWVNLCPSDDGFTFFRLIKLR